MKYFLSILSFFLFSSVALTPVFAAGDVLPSPTPCQPVYGGGTSCVSILTITKAVQNPSDKGFVHNLTVNDSMYLPEQTVSFKIVVSNTSDKTVNSVVIKDTFPQYLTFVSGPGSFDSKNRSVSVKIDSLKKDETKTYDLKMKIAKADALPKNGETFCLINQATATVNKEVVSDNSQFCVQNKATAMKVVPTQVPNSSKGGLPLYQAPKVTTTPSTGAESLALLALAPLGGIGLLLRRRIK